MLNAVIIDDELEALHSLSFHLKKIPEINLLGAYNNPEQASIEILNSLPDIVFLDIVMPRCDGFSFFEMIKNLKKIPRVVFVTSYDKYKTEIGINENIQLLLKPVDPVKLRELIDYFLSTSPKEDALSDIGKSVNALSLKNKIAIKSNDGIQMVRYSDIVYLEADGNYTYFYLRNGKKLCETTNIKEIENRLSKESFFRCHKSFIINTNYLERIEGQKEKYCILSTPEKDYEIIISRRKFQALEF